LDRPCSESLLHGKLHENHGKAPTSVSEWSKFAEVWGANLCERCPERFERNPMPTKR